eukprot:RCo027556
MGSRLDVVRCLGFSAHITTNYSKELCSCPYPCGLCATSCPLPASKAEFCRSTAEMCSTPMKFPPPYMDIIHGKPTLWEDAAKKGEGNGSQRDGSTRDMREEREDSQEKKWVAPVLQIHGSVNMTSTIVLSREGYRRLLNSAPYYQDFLKSLVLSRTILYLGYSFTDDYLNEIRSDVISMRSGSRTKIAAYALIN